jgi:hypothetical protein
MSGGDLDEIKELLAIERKLDPNSMTVWRNSIMLEQRETPLSDILARTISTHSISTHSISTRSISTDGLAKWKAIFGGASE